MQTPTMFSITCTPKHHAFGEQGDLWCFDYTFLDGSSVKDEPLMPEATELVNRLLKNKYGQNSSIDKIELTFSNTVLSRPSDITLQYVEDEEGGCNYKPYAWEEWANMKIWLCPVFTQFFPEEKPKKLYVKVEKAS
mgnify:FL=1